MAKYVLAHDLGSSGNKATLFDESGKLITSTVSNYSMEVFNRNWAEQDPKVWWNAVCESSREVLKKIDTNDLVSVAFSAQMMGCLVIDKNGNPLHKSILYCDQRSEEQINKLINKIGFDKIYSITGHRPSSSYSLSKLIWIKDNLPEVFSKVDKILQAKDYMNYLLTGNIFTDYNDASGTNAFDLHSFNWSKEILDAAEIDISIFPKVVPSETIVGRVSKWASEQTGIPQGVKVIAGAGDGGCASLGAGSIREYVPYCYLGSSSWVSIASKDIISDEKHIGFTWAHPVKNYYQPCATMQTAGASISWFANTFLGNSKGKTLDEINDLAFKSSPGANGVMFLPYLLGERSPWWNSNATGSFVGLNVNTVFADLCRALFEGIAFNLYINFSSMESVCGNEPMRIIGGGVLNKALIQILADVFGRKLIYPRYLTEATSMGAAMLAGIGGNVYSNYDIINKMNPDEGEIKPNMNNHKIYKKKLFKFKETYHNLNN
jgi:xylulokinase